MTKWLLGLLCALMVLPTPSRAQGPQPATSSSTAAEAASAGDMKFSSRTELVLVPVLVTKGSEHVPRLKKEDFALKQDGKPQRLTIFEEIKASNDTVLKSPSLPNGVFSNLQSDLSAKRLLIIAVDGANTPVSNQPFVKKQLVKYLSQGLPNNTMVSLVVIGRGHMRVLHSFTKDPQLLLSALSAVNRGNLREQAATISNTQERGAEQAATIELGQDPIDEQLNDEIGALKDFVTKPMHQFAAAESATFGYYSRRIGALDTLAALQQIAQSYAGVPGRKALVWITEGFPFTLDDFELKGAKGVPSASLSEVIGEYNETWRVLNQANVALYPVDARGLVNTSLVSADVGMSSRALNRQIDANVAGQRADAANRIATMQTFASMTGGQAYFNTNGLVKSIQRASEDSSAYYLLGFYLDKDTKPGWHKLKVELAHNSGHVRARSGFFVASPTQNQADAGNADLAMATESPVDFTGLPFYLKWQDTAPSAQPGKRKISCKISMPPGVVTVDEADRNHVLLKAVALARAEKNKDSAETAEMIDAHLKPNTVANFRAASFSKTLSLDLLPGTYSIRFVIKDELSGRLGSLTVPLVVK